VSGKKGTSKGSEREEEEDKEMPRLGEDIYIAKALLWLFGHQAIVPGPWVCEAEALEMLSARCLGRPGHEKELSAWSR
jgi:hypothetical protein